MLNHGDELYLQWLDISHEQMTDTLRSYFKKSCSIGKNQDPKTHAYPSENIQKFNLNISRQVIIFHHIDRSHCLFLANLLHLDYTALYKKSQWWNHRKLFFLWQYYNLPPHPHGTCIFVLTIPRILTYYLFYKSISDTPTPPKHNNTRNKAGIIRYISIITHCMVQKDPRYTDRNLQTSVFSPT